MTPQEPRGAKGPSESEALPSALRASPATAAGVPGRAARPAPGPALLQHRALPAPVAPATGRPQRPQLRERHARRHLPPAAGGPRRRRLRGRSQTTGALSSKRCPEINVDFAATAASSFAPPLASWGGSGDGWATHPTKGDLALFIIYTEIGKRRESKLGSSSLKLGGRRTPPEAGLHGLNLYMQLEP